MGSQTVGAVGTSGLELANKATLVCSKASAMDLKQSLAELLAVKDLGNFLHILKHQVKVGSKQ